MLLLRKFLFVVFTIIYIIVCPLLVLYALGYIYNPVKKELVHTGVLNLVSNPAGADIYLAKSRFSYQTPAVIRELLPGNYKITLKKKGYKAWTHTITIEAGKAVALKNILLIPNNWQPENITADRCRDLIPIENERMFLITNGTELKDFFAYDTAGGIHPLYYSQSSLADMTITKVFSVAKSDIIVLCGNLNGSKKYVYINLKNKKFEPVDITKLFVDVPRFISWQGQKDIEIFAVRKDCVDFLKLKPKQVLYSCYWEKIKGFGIYEDGCYIIDQNTVLVYQAVDGSKKKNLSEDMHLAQRLFDKSDFYNIDTGNNEILVFLGTKGDFLVNFPPYVIADRDIAGYRFADNPDLLVCWTKESVKLVDFSIGKDRSIFHENFKVQPIYESGRNIKQVIWADEDSHLLINDSDSIYLIELLPQGEPHIEFICKIKNNTKVFYDNGEKALYYLDDSDGTLKRLRIIPKQPIVIHLLK